MAEKKGLPPGFDLNIAPQSEAPVRIGDYLDDVEAPTLQIESHPNVETEKQKSSSCRERCRPPRITFRGAD